MADHGMKVSRDGYAATTSDPRELVWSSAFNGFKIHAQGATTVTIALNQTVGSTTIAHSLGYTPAFLAFAESQNSGYTAYRQLINDFSLEPGTDYLGVSAYTDGTNLVIRAERDTLSSGYPAAKTINIYYFIFKDVAA